MVHRPAISPSLPTPDVVMQRLLHCTPNPALVEPNAPYNATVVLDSFFGQPSINLNDLEVLKGGEGGDAVFFTDAL